MPARADAAGTASRAAPRERPERRISGGLAVAGVVLAAVGVPLALTLATGADAVPRNDAWAFARAALTLARTGELELTGWGPMTLVGHLLYAQPWLALLGPSLRTLTFAQAAAGAAGLVGVHLLARRLLAPPSALVVTALVAVLPGYALYATGFMTDTTAFAAQVACLLWGVTALERPPRTRGVWLVAALTVGVYGFSIREFALAAPLAVLLAHGVHAARAAERRRLRGLAALGALVVAAAVAILWWRAGLGGRPDVPVGLSPLRVAAFGVAGYFTLAFTLIPALCLADWREVRDRLRGGRRVVAGAAVAAVLVAGLAAVLVDLARASPTVLLAGNALTPFGSMEHGVLLGNRGVLFPPPVWAAVVIAAMLAGAALTLWLAAGVAGAASRPLSPPAPAAVALAGFALLSVGALGAYALIGGFPFDRYLWGPALALAVLLVARGPGRRTRRRAAASALVALGVLAFATVVEELTFDVARWRAGEAAVRHGIPAEQVDAGFEWVGWHYPGRVLEPGVPPAWLPPAGPYMPAFPRAGSCGVVSASARAEPWLQQLERRPHRAFIVAGDRELWVYRNPRACGARSP
ncbi:MAG TPA: glycosyltransferase family 39 protein [Egibacteraceae bacterium]|nr:glycosyltransferase family 39 protein [Egibacteraceae bacterium]